MSLCSGLVIGYSLATWKRKKYLQYLHFFWLFPLFYCFQKGLNWFRNVLSQLRAKGTFQDLSFVIGTFWVFSWPLLTSLFPWLQRHLLHRVEVVTFAKLKVESNLIDYQSWKMLLDEVGHTNVSTWSDVSYEACICLMIAFVRSDWPTLARDAQRRAEVDVSNLNPDVSNVDS